MPRAKQRRGLDGCVVQPFQLPDTPANRTGVETCIRLAGLSPRTTRASRFWHDIGDVLERSRALETLEAEIPRPASERAALNQLESALSALTSAIDDLDAMTRDRLAFARADLVELRRQSEACDRAITIADRAVAAQESRGAAPRRARRTAVNWLAEVFQTHEEGHAHDYAERLQDVLIEAATLGGISMPRADRVLALVSPSLKVPRRIP